MDKAVYILISWLHEKPADLDLHFFKKGIYTLKKNIVICTVPGFFKEGTLRAFQIGKISVKPLNWEICYSAQLWHFWSITKQVSYYTYTSPCSLCMWWLNENPNLKTIFFLCPQRNFGRHIVIALSVRQSVRPAFVSGPYLLYSLRLEFQILCVDTTWDGGVSCNIFRSLWPWHLT